MCDPGFVFFANFTEINFDEDSQHISYYNSTVIEAILDNLNETSNLTSMDGFLLAINQTDNFTAIEGYLVTLKRIENFTSIAELLDVYNSTTIEDFIDEMSTDLNTLNDPYIWELYDNMGDNYTINSMDDYSSFAHNISNLNRGYSNISRYNSTVNLNRTSKLTNIEDELLSLKETDNFTAIEGFVSALKRIDNFTSVGELLDIYNLTSIEDLIVAMSNDLKNLKNFHIWELLGDIYNITDRDDYFDSANNLSHFENFTRSKLIICSQDLEIDVPWETDPPGECERE